MFSRLCVLMLSAMLCACATHPGGVDQVRFARDRSFVTATTEAGVVRGVEGAAVRAFLGVPYAAPPVGDLRWRGPRPVAPWTGVRDATKIGSDCTQALGREAILGGGGGLVVGSEDCLFVLWTRERARAGATRHGLAARRGVHDRGGSQL